MIRRSKKRKVGSENENERCFFEEKEGDLKTLERRRKKEGIEMGELIKRDREE